MKNKMIIGIFLCLASVQIITPLSMITKREFTLKNGKQFKFKTEPVDPYDAFRGRYVSLRIKGDNIPRPKGLTLTSGQNVFALIDIDEQGFAKLSSVTTSRPDKAPYIQAKVGYNYNSGENVQLDLQMDRYYMEEKSAPLAEKIYREHNARDKQDAYILAKINDGFAVIESLYVGGRRIEEAVKDAKKK